MSPEELIQEMKGKDISAFVLTDINSTSGCLSFVRESTKYGIRPIIGVDFRNGAKQQFVAVAKNNEGFQEINTFLSSLLHKKKEIPEHAPEFDNVYVIYPFLNRVKYRLRENEYYGVSRFNIYKIIDEFNLLKNYKNKTIKNIILKIIKNFAKDVYLPKSLLLYIYDRWDIFKE